MCPLQSSPQVPIPARRPVKRCQTDVGRVRRDRRHPAQTGKICMNARQYQQTQGTLSRPRSGGRSDRANAAGVCPRNNSRVRCGKEPSSCRSGSSSSSTRSDGFTHGPPPSASSFVSTTCQTLLRHRVQRDFEHMTLWLAGYSCIACSAAPVVDTNHCHG